MSDLYFVSDLTIADDFGSAIEVRAGEILTDVPVDLAARLLQRSDVRVAEPGMDVRRYSFKDPRRHNRNVARFIAPPIDALKWAADEETKEKAVAAMKSQRDKAAARARENRETSEAAVREAEKAEAEARKQREEDEKKEKAKASSK